LLGHEPVLQGDSAKVAISLDGQEFGRARKRFRGWRRPRSRDRERARARALPTAPTARQRRNGIGLARPRREARTRSRAEDRPPTGTAGPRAEREATAAAQLSIRPACGRIRWHATRGTCTSPTSTSPAARCVTRSTTASSTTSAASRRRRRS
jgi:hypothetical protein